MKRVVILLLLVLAGFAPAQYYFGKNKIQYADYDWQRLRTEHFDIYFFGPEEKLARITAREVEEYWEDHVASFRFVPRARIPVIIYPAPNLFQETNTIPMILPEGVGGFTEYFKGRVVLPFNGSYRDFRHTLKHELVHAFVLHKNTFVHDAHELFFLEFLPLWFEEGLAEHLSERRSREMEMVMRSGALEGTLVPLDRIYMVYGSFLMYKEAESFLDWLAGEYGESRIPRLMEDIHDFDDFSSLFAAHFGISLEEAGRRWMNHVHEKYWPMITEGELPGELGRILMNGAPGFELSPVMHRFPGDSLASIFFQSTRMGYVGIYRMEAGNPKSAELVIRGGFSEKLEDMHLFQNSYSISENGVLCLSAKAQGGDALNFVDAESGEILLQKKFESIPGISSPNISAAGNVVAFSGTDLSGFKDIYLYRVEEDSLLRLTGDIYGDSDPILFEDYIYFSSDRISGGDDGEKSVCRIPSSGGKIQYLAGLSGNCIGPAVGDEGELLFSSSHDRGIQNIWRFYLDSVEAERITNILTAYLEPAPLAGDSLLVSVFTENSYKIAAVPADSVYQRVTVRWEDWETSWEPREMASEAATSKMGRDRRLTLDIAQGAMSTSTSMESGGGIEGVFSDMLGDRQLYFMVYEQIEDVENLLRNLNIAAIYYNMEDRPIWGAGGYHYYTEGFNVYDFGFSEERAGVLGTVSYPFSRFMRAGATGYLEYSKKSYFADLEPDREGGFATLNLSLIRDNSLWGRTGPIEGFRGNATAGATVRLNTGEISSYLTSADLRYYLRLTRRSTLAFRLLGRSSGGDEPQRFWMGGTWDFRGYPFYSFYGRNLVFTSTELRFPVFDQFRMRFPFLDVNLHGIRGAIFYDTGQVWEDEWIEPVASVGTGLRMNLGNVTCLRFDVAWRTDYETGFERPYYDIFFGWDF